MFRCKLWRRESCALFIREASTKGSAARDRLVLEFGTLLDVAFKSAP